MNSEDYRIQQDCRSRGGIQDITAENEHDDNSTAYLLVVCKDGSGPWKEITDFWRDHR